jgi:hypothetical protein
MLMGSQAAGPPRDLVSKSDDEILYQSYMYGVLWSVDWGSLNSDRSPESLYQGFRKSTYRYISAVEAKAT